MKDRTAELGVSEEVAKRCAVIVDEMVGNMIRHDATLGVHHDFEADISVTAGVVRMVISDPGAPFDPTTHRHEVPPEKGGHGLNVVRSMTATFHYARVDGYNRSTVLVSEE